MNKFLLTLLSFCFFGTTVMAAKSTPQKIDFLFSVDGHELTALLEPIDLQKFERYICLPAFGGRNYWGMEYKGASVKLLLGGQRYELAPQIELPFPDYLGATHHEFYYIGEERECLEGLSATEYEYINRLVLMFRNIDFPNLYVVLEIKPVEGVAYLRDHFKRDVIAYGRIK